MTKRTVANLLVDALVVAGVKRVYWLAGDSLNGITESIRTRDDIQWFRSGTKNQRHLLRERMLI